MPHHEILVQIVLVSDRARKFSALLLLGLHHIAPCLQLAVLCLFFIQIAAACFFLSFGLVRLFGRKNLSYSKCIAVNEIEEQEL